MPSSFGGISGILPVYPLWFSLQDFHLLFSDREYVEVWDTVSKRSGSRKGARGDKREGCLFLSLKRYGFIMVTGHSAVWEHLGMGKSKF